MLHMGALSALHSFIVYNWLQLWLFRTNSNQLLKQSRKETKKIRLVQIGKNDYLQIKQSHALPSHFAMKFLNFVKLPPLFISSFKILHRRLSLNESPVHIYLFALVEDCIVPQYGDCKAAVSTKKSHTCAGCIWLVVL